MVRAEVQETNTLSGNVNAVFRKKHQKWWLASIVIFGGLGDAIKDYFRDKAIALAISKLGGLGDFIVGNPFALTSIALVAALLVLTIMVVSESSQEVPSALFEHRDKKFMKPAARRPWLASFILVMVLLISLVCIGTWRYWLHIHTQSTNAVQSTSPPQTSNLAPIPKVIKPNLPDTNRKTSHVKKVTRIQHGAPSPNQSPAAQIQNQPAQSTAANSLTEGDRERLSNLVHEFAQVLNMIRDLGVRANSEIGLVNSAIKDGSIVNNYETHLKNLRTISSTGTELARKFSNTRAAGDWSYYSTQTNYVFGDNPDNLGPNAIINDASLAYTVEQWSSIKDRENKSALSLLSGAEADAERSLKVFYDWNSGCQSRLEKLKQSLDHRE
jgi:hypothetical protein